MDRRTFLKTATLGAMAAGITREAAAAAEKYFPVKADQSLFATINRAKDPAKLSPLEQKHVPVIKAPAKVKSGEPFTVEVTVGEVVHPMGMTHWIEFIELNVGNEPAGRVEMQPRGFLNPKVTFTVVIPKEAAPAGKITLVAHERCNLHGYWEGSVDVTVTG
ncbi:class II SORL domain-containing protein [Geobacter sp.]|uniref:class II SORL domain-containing protein n=1 Tax=Geobacter sp. TaxID=46610 RepID=UPI0027B8AABD|nr:class II SORL domain-containing protein [Geobacter sp.]